VLKIENEALKASDMIAICALSGTLVGVYEASGAATAINISRLAPSVYVVKAGRQAAKLVVVD
jgi:hypothetical protein